MNQPTTTYTVSEGLLQAIIRNLEAQPAAQSRHLLNTIESECVQQDRTRMESAQTAERQRIEKEVQERLVREQSQAKSRRRPRVQTPAQGAPTS